MRKTSNTFSIFGQIEEVVAMAMIREDKGIMIPLNDIPMSARYQRFPDGKDREAKFAIRLPDKFVHEFEERILDLRA